MSGKCFVEVHIAITDITSEGIILQCEGDGSGMDFALDLDGCFAEDNGIDVSELNKEGIGVYKCRLKVDYCITPGSIEGPPEYNDLITIVEYTKVFDWTKEVEYPTAIDAGDVTEVEIQ